VVLDEIGRGTSTFDGLSIAWAVAEYLMTNSRARPKTLFATHYHELTDLADGLPGIVNAHVAAREWNEEIVFLRKIVAGRSDRSYGIQVARLAGLPPAVVARAREILVGLERDELSRGGRPTLSHDAGAPSTRQLGLFASPDEGAGAGSGAGQAAEVFKRLREIDVDDTTPRQAWDVLAELKRLVDGD
jgi:DNA mismatch repair protein MutS